MEDSSSFDVHYRIERQRFYFREFDLGFLSVLNFTIKNGGRNGQLTCCIYPFIGALTVCGCKSSPETSSGSGLSASAGARNIDLSFEYANKKGVRYRTP